MTQDEIIEMAREVGMEQDGDMWFSNLYKTDMDVHISHLEAFAKLVAAKEREAIEKLFEEVENNTEPHKDYEDYDDGWVDACYACKWAVTARGEA